MKLLSFGRKSEEQMGLRLDQALHSLRARGIVESFQRTGTARFRLQWSRGNYGVELAAERARGWQLQATPIANPAGPFAAKNISDEVRPIAEWAECGEPAILTRLDRVGHIELVDWIRELENRHPAAAWLAEQVRRLAVGERLDNETLQAMVLLGARRFLKTIPGSDRLHEAIEPALVTLIGMTRRTPPKAAEAELEVFAGQDYGRTLVDVLQETHPLEARRAVQLYMSGR